MNEKKLLKAAERAKEDGYEIIYSIVKSENSRPLYHLVSIEVFLSLGRWLPCKVQNFKDKDGKEKIGIKIWHKLPEKAISKRDLLRKYGK